jgi:PAS domain S-box-containing protein
MPPVDPPPAFHQPQFARALFDEHGDALLLVDPDTDAVLAANRTAARLTGLPAEELVGRAAGELLAGDADADPADGLRAAAAHTVLFHGHGGYRLRTAGGGWRPVTVTVGRLHLRPKPLALYTVRDDADRRAALDRAREAEAVVRREHALLDALFDALPDVVCVKDRGLRFRAGNPAFERLAGRPMADLVGRSCREVFPAAWADRLRAAEGDVLATGRPVRAEEWVEYPDGRPALFDVFVCPLPGEDGGVVVVGRDVTDRRRLEDQLRHAQKMDAVGQLAGGVAHDFNNLLTVILGNLELARAECRGRKVDDLLRGTERAAARAADLTGQLLGFARRQPMRFQPVGLGEMVRETAALLRRTIDPRVRIDTRADAAGAVWADPGQVNQVLMNLCLNARDAMPDGGTLTVEVDRPAGGRYVRLSVSDTGRGMPAEVQARIFEPFFTTKGTGQGTGLGLAVVFGIVDAHGGRIECASRPGAGTRFDVYLPAYDGPAATVTDPTPEPVASPAGRGERVLVVDDEPMIRELAAAVLEPLGYRVTLAADGAEGVGQFRAAGGRFDLVILDLTMPTLSGRETLEALLAIDPGVRVLLASGYSADREAMAGRVTGFLDKPYSPGDLARAVRRALDGD